MIDAALGLDVEAVLMEGYRRVDEWHLIERAIDNFDVVFLRNEDSVAQMGRGRLTREELAVLELVNGKIDSRQVERIDKVDGVNYACVRIAATMTCFWEVARFPLCRQRLTVELEDDGG